MPVGTPDLTHLIAALGPWKIAHRAELRDAAVTPSQLRLAVERSLLLPVRRDWFAAASCHPELVRAVHAGATLDCVSAAAVHGLWALDVDSVHVSLARSSKGIRRTPPPLPGYEQKSDFTLHWTRDPEPQAAPRVRAVIASVPRTLAQVASCQPLERAVAVVDSALRRQRIEVHELRELARRDPALARVLEHAEGTADSETESLARVRLRKRGILMVPQVVIDGHAVDGLIGNRLVLQIDGFGPHSGRSRRNRDLKQDDRLRRKGFIVLRYSGDQVRWEWPMIESAILSIVAAGRHLRAA